MAQPSLLQATTSKSGLPFYDIFSPLRDSAISTPDYYGFVATLNHLWNIAALISLVVSAFFIFGFVYSLHRTNQLLAEQSNELRAAEKKFQEMRTGIHSQNSRWEDVQKHSASLNPNDWRLAIIEADIMLDDALAELGLAGNTIGEKLKSASTLQLRSLDDAWRAHRVRNEIAHAGSDFVLTHKLAEETIMQYSRVFRELGKI